MNAGLRLQQALVAFGHFGRQCNLVRPCTVLHITITETAQTAATRLQGFGLGRGAFPYFNTGSNRSLRRRRNTRRCLGETAPCCCCSCSQCSSVVGEDEVAMPLAKL